jgi:hypothetical protein
VVSDISVDVCRPVDARVGRTAVVGRLTAGGVPEPAAGQENRRRTAGEYPGIGDIVSTEAAREGRSPGVTGRFPPMGETSGLFDDARTLIPEEQ